MNIKLYSSNYQYMINNQYIDWQIDKNLKQNFEYKGNNKLAKVLSNKGYKQIEKNYTNIGKKEILKILNHSKIFKTKVKGYGIDLGGGAGIISSTIALSKKVKKIYCCEMVENAVRYCQPIVKKKILKKNTKKVISVVGDFNKIKLKDNTIDFAIIWDSLHHSLKPIRTLTEIKRVLKKNSFLFVVDRAHNDETKNFEIKKMLDHVYDKNFKKRNFFPLNKKITRRMNGENEYRFRDLKKFFNKSGFKISELKILCSDKQMRKNDIGLKEIYINFDMSGFFKRKVIYALKK